MEATPMYKKIPNTTAIGTSLRRGDMNTDKPETNIEVEIEDKRSILVTDEDRY